MAKRSLENLSRVSKLAQAIIKIIGTLVSNPKEILNVLNSYFANIGANLANNISQITKTYKDYFKKKPTVNSFMIEKVIPQKVESRSDKFDSWKQILWIVFYTCKTFKNC